MLELLVVIAIMAMATALIGPPSYRMLASWQHAQQAEQILGELAALPQRPLEDGLPLSLAAGDVPEGLLDSLPKDWALRLDRPLVVQINGACSGSAGTLSSPRLDWPFELEAPYCRVRLREAPP